MSLPAESRSKIRFGEFEVDMQTAEVRQNGHKFVLQFQPFQVLAILLERPGELVSREELKQRLWSSDTFVDFDHSLNKAVNRLREALSDSAEAPRYIETFPRRGYRFIAEIAPDPVSQTPHISGTSPNGEAIDSASPSADANEGAVGFRKIWTFAAIAALVILGASGAWRFWPRAQRTKFPSFENLEVTRLTNNGTVSNVAISPDGRYVAYVPNLDGKQELRLRQLATGTDTHILPPDPGLFVGLTFSPDGHYIYFVRSDRNDVAFRYLYSVPLLGGSPRKVITDVDSNIAFSPDGREMAYEHWDPPANRMELKIAHADGSGERILTVLHDTNFLTPGGPGPNWSPDGRTIAVPLEMAKGPNRSILFTVSVSDGTAHELYKGAEELGHAVWQPSGDHLLLQMFDVHSRRAQLWSISFPEGTASRLTHDAAEYWQDLDSTRDGKTLAAIAANWRSRIWASDSPSFIVAKPITPADPPMSSVKMNNRGRLFARDLSGNLWSINPDGTALTKIEGIHDVNVVQRCADLIVYSSNGENSDTLIRLDSDGMHPMTLISGNLFSPSCSHDGQLVYYVDSKFPQAIWRVGISGGKPERVTPVLGDSILGFAVVSPDGKFLAYPYSTYSTGTPGDHYAVINTSDGSTVKSFDMQRAKFDNGPYWSPDGKYLQFVATRGGVSNIWQHPIEGGPARQLTHFSSEEIFDFSWSPDGSRLFLTRGIASSDVVLLSGIQ
jgi:Tol biopolymer transport system component/DNA-binding winged helix-turn-helix (wHTH) protein